jgi:hypothetical protein
MISGDVFSKNSASYEEGSVLNILAGKLMNNRVNGMGMS